jgi:hypothetical protein
MPTASDEQRKLMQKWFGEEIDTTGPLTFLLDRGWTDNAGLLVPPVPSHHPSDYELECIYYLVDEWDFGYCGRPKLW